MIVDVVSLSVVFPAFENKNKIDDLTLAHKGVALVREETLEHINTIYNA